MPVGRHLQPVVRVDPFARLEVYDGKPAVDNGEHIERPGIASLAVTQGLAAEHLRASLLEEHLQALEVRLSFRPDAHVAALERGLQNGMDLLAAESRLFRLLRWSGNEVLQGAAWAHVDQLV